MRELDEFLREKTFTPETRDIVTNIIRIGLRYKIKGVNDTKFPFMVAVCDAKSLGIESQETISKIGFATCLIGAVCSLADDVADDDLHKWNNMPLKTAVSVSHWLLIATIEYIASFLDDNSIVFTKFRRGFEGQILSVQLEDIDEGMWGIIDALRTSSTYSIMGAIVDHFAKINDCKRVDAEFIYYETGFVLQAVSDSIKDTDKVKRIKTKEQKKYYLSKIASLKELCGEKLKGTWDLLNDYEIVLHGVSVKK
jgi:hypothetical protein